MIRLPLCAVALLFFVQGMAQEDSVKTKQLEEVIITGQYRPQTVKNSVYQVRTISRERIIKQGATRLQDVLMSELNIRFNQDVATGGSNITMMGLTGQNVKILIDGLPLIGRQGTSNEININQIDINTIERIEIVEGPMSVIYGADALAGVINIITKKSGPGRFSVNARLHEESVGQEYGIQQGIHNQSVGISYRYRNWDLGGQLGRNYFGGWKDTAIGRELVWHKKDQILGSGYIGWNKNGLNLRYRIDGLDEIITNPGNFDYYQSSSGDTLALDQEYLSQRLMHQLQGSYFVNSGLSFQLQSSFTDYSRQVFSTTVSQKTGAVRLNTAAGTQSVIDFTGFSTRGTALVRLSEQWSVQPGFDINMESGSGERLKEGTNKVNDYAFFVTSEYTPSKKINIRPGLRFIKNSVYNAPPLIPSINTKFALGKDLDLRISYARGFRSPSLRELYFNFFDANHQIVGNPDLKAETSHSFTGSLSWKKMEPGKVAYTTVIGGFYNSVKNLIDYAMSANDPNIFQLTNVSDSRTAGFNLSSVAKYKNVSISAGASYTGFFNDLSETDKALPELQWSAEVNASVGYKWVKPGLDLNVFYKYTGKRPSYILSGSDILLTSLKGYHWADITLTKSLFKVLSLQAGVRNLFNVDRIRNSVVGNGVHAANGTRSIGTGRSGFVGLVFDWAKN